jgi:hypothetical protein
MKKIVDEGTSLSMPQSIHLPPLDLLADVTAEARLMMSSKGDICRQGSSLRN